MGKRKTELTKTQAEVAKHFGVSERTVRSWIGQGMPTEGKGYDVAAIEQWLDRVGLGRRAEKASRAKLAEVEAQIKTVKLHRLRGELIELDTVRRLFVRHISEAKSVLEQVPDRVLAVLPAAVAAKDRTRVRAEVVGILDAACRSLADTLTAGELPEESA